MDDVWSEYGSRLPKVLWVALEPLGDEFGVFLEVEEDFAGFQMPNLEHGALQHEGDDTLDFALHLCSFDLLGWVEGFLDGLLDLLDLLLG